MYCAEATGVVTHPFGTLVHRIRGGEKGIFSLKMGGLKTTFDGHTCVYSDSKSFTQKKSRSSLFSINT